MTKLRDIYQQLERKYCLNGDIKTFLDLLKDIKGEEQLKAVVEQLILQCAPGFSFPTWNEDEKIYTIDYLRKRVAETKNPHLCLKYALSVYKMTNEYVYMQKAVSFALGILKTLMEQHNMDSDNFVNLYKTIFPYCYKTNDKDNIIVVGRKALFESFNEDLQFGMLNMIYFKENEERNSGNKNVAGHYHLGRIFDYKKLAKLAHNLASNQKADFIDIDLKMAVFFASHSNDNALIRKVNEEYGDYLFDHLYPDDEHNLAIAPMNDEILRKVMSLYKSARVDEKYKTAAKKYEENKKKQKFIRFQVKISGEEYQKGLDAINKVVTNIYEKGEDDVWGTLFFSNVFLVSKDGLLQKIKEMKSSIFNYYGMIVMDSFNNAKAVDKDKYNLSIILKMTYENFTYHILQCVVLSGIKTGILSYDKLANWLLELGFDLRMGIYNNGEEITTTYLERVDIGLREFFVQNERLMKGEPQDWRFCISFLTPQFEGFVRDIVKRMDDPIDKVKHSTDDTELLPLESLLKSPCMKKLFTDEDLLLFSYTFTKSGVNIRNRVAHGMLIPQEYTASNALLVFISILRLVKATMRFDML